MKKLTVSVLLLMALLTLPMLAIPKGNALPTNLAHLQGDRIGEPMDIDPAWAYDTSSAEMLMNIYDPLLFFNRTNMDSYTPRLATEWKVEAINEVSPEGLPWKGRVTFKLRGGVHFQTDGVNNIPGEGALLTTDDVEYTFERFFVTDAATGPAWMVWDPMFAASWAGDVSDALTALGHAMNTTTGWNTKVDEAIDHAVENNATHVWFNLAMPYEPFLQIVAQNWGSIVNKAWCVWHGDWPGMQVGDSWANYHDPAVSPLTTTDPHSPGPHLDCALGTGPYMLDYWNKGAGNSLSYIKNPTYWEGWTLPFRHDGWGAGEEAIAGHVDRYTSNYIPEWSTRRLRFLGGVVDFCDVPRMFMGQVLNQPGIVCDYPLPQLAADGCFFSFGVAATSTHLGVTTPNGTFASTGAPRDMFEDKNLRLAMSHMIDWDTYLYAAFLDEAVSPVTPIIPGLTYYDDTIGQKEDPSVPQHKMLGITGEPAGQLAFDLALAKTYLQAAWGGQVWANGFTIDAVYNEGNLARQMAAQLMKDAFDYMNANFGTQFTVNLVSIPWSVYKLEWRARNLPYFIVGWLADYPDAHNFAHPFMHSQGAFSKWQGVLGYNSFPNAYVDNLIAKGIGTVIPEQRQGNYSLLQHYYVDEALGLITVQSAGRHWERDWVQGWYYNPIYPGNYIYDLWKDIAVTLQDVDVAVSNFACPTRIHVYEASVNTTISLDPSPISVTVSRLDANGAAPTVLVLIGVGLRDEAGREVILDTDNATLGIGGTYTADFYSFEQDPAAPIYSGYYTLFAEVLLSSGFANDINTGNNINNQTPMFAISPGDCNQDATCDMADISLCIDSFMTTPFMDLWNVICDTNRDQTIDMADISTCIDFFMISYPPFDA